MPPRHPAHLIRELVRTQLDLRQILAEHNEVRGYPPQYPAMMTALLLYGYTKGQGLFSSRKLAKSCEEHIDFMAVTAMKKPDHRTICKFRLRHADALVALFVQGERGDRRKEHRTPREEKLEHLHVALQVPAVRAPSGRSFAGSSKPCLDCRFRRIMTWAEWLRGV